MTCERDNYVFTRVIPESIETTLAKYPAGMFPAVDRLREARDERFAEMWRRISAKKKDVAGDGSRCG